VPQMPKMPNDIFLSIKNRRQTRAEAKFIHLIEAGGAGAGSGWCGGIFVILAGFYRLIYRLKFSCSLFIGNKLKVHKVESIHRHINCKD
jgi:hypothetical protein